MCLSHCRLCTRAAILRESHIFPRFLFTALRNEKGHFLGISGNGRYGVDVLQDGLKEHLLCDECEALCSVEYERPFQRLWMSRRHQVLTSPWHPDKTLTLNVDYRSFKLFHLLNLWRSSISSLPSCRSISLGPHEESIRKMLLSKDPGPEEKYAVSAHAMYDGATLQIPKFFHPALAFRDGPRRAYQMAYGGARWTVLISCGGAPNHRRVSLKAGGTIELTGVDWRKLESVRFASSLLRDKPPRPQ